MAYSPITLPASTIRSEMYVSIFRHRSDLAYVVHVNSLLQAEGEDPYILLREINVENTNLILERTDRIPHRDT